MVEGEKNSVRYLGDGGGDDDDAVLCARYPGMRLREKSVIN